MEGPGGRAWDRYAVEGTEPLGFLMEGEGQIGVEAGDRGVGGGWRFFG